MSSYESRQVRAASLRALGDSQLKAARRALESERVPFTLDALRAHSEAYEDVLAEVTRRRFGTPTDTLAASADAIARTEQAARIAGNMSGPSRL